MAHLLRVCLRTAAVFAYTQLQLDHLHPLVDTCWAAHLLGQGVEAGTWQWEAWPATRLDAQALHPGAGDPMDRKRKLEVYSSVGAAPADGSAATLATPSGSGGVNPFTSRPYSARYYDILSTRQGGMRLKMGVHFRVRCILDHGAWGHGVLL